ncbi:MAG TPA: hypothetical protein VJ884_03240, partial [Salinibacter sp.]|nr:hypothetical protein [Salinibacter sp.]
MSLVYSRCIASVVIRAGLLCVLGVAVVAQPVRSQQPTPASPAVPQSPDLDRNALTADSIRTLGLDEALRLFR